MKKRYIVLVILVGFICGAAFDRHVIEWRDNVLFRKQGEVTTEAVKSAQEAHQAFKELVDIQNESILLLRECRELIVKQQDDYDALYKNFLFVIGGEGSSKR